MEEVEIEVLEDHGEVPCYICGTEATRYTTFMPICSNPVCYEVRKEEVLEAVKSMSKAARGGKFEND